MRGILRLLLGVALVIVVAWLGLWWWAEGQMEDGINAWASQTAGAANYTVSYDRLNRGTSPFAALVTLTNLRVSIQPDAAAQPVQIVLPSVALRINVLQPLLLHIDWPDQINVNTPRADLVVTAASLETIEAIDPHELLSRAAYPFKDMNFTGSNIDALASSGSLLILHVDSVAVHVALNRNAGKADTAWSMTESMNDIALSPLLTRLASIPFDGKISSLGLKMDVSGPIPADFAALAGQIDALPVSDQAGRNKIVIQAVHDWAAAGGNAGGSLSLVVGPSTLTANGAVTFNSQAQPSGTAELNADHLDEISAAITNAYPQTQGAANEIQAHLSPYLTSSDAGGQTLAMHVVYGKGIVSVNGQTVLPLPPIDWQALENPPPPLPAPAQAPGDGSGAAL